MKMFKKNSIVTLVVAFFVLVILGFANPNVASAATTATTPSLGSAISYGVLADTYTNTTGPAGITTINGDVGFTTGPAITPLPLPRPSGTYPNYGSGGNYSAAGTAQATALTALNSGTNATCDFTFAPGAIDLATDMTHVTAGHGSVIREYYPGVYCTAGAASALSIGGAGIILNGAGTYIFRNDGALNTVTGSSVTLSGGASACNVFWTPNGATTLNYNSSFVGTVIPVSQDITLYDNVTWLGRALTFGHTVTTPGSNAIITVPTSCGVVPPPVTTTLNIIKHVINDNGGTSSASNFTLTIGGVTAVGGNTVVGAESPGITKTLSTVGAYTVTETSPAGYTQSSSADCSGTIAAGETRTCTITNNDTVPVIPPVTYYPPVPALPNTGVGSNAQSTPWNIAILSSILILVSTSAVLVLRKRKA